MTEKQQVAKTKEKAMQAAHTTETGTTYVPDVDISESGDHITLTADMPGVDQNSVDVSVENNTLTIEGKAHVDAPDGYKLVGQEYGVGTYRRDFTLSSEVDTTGIKARMRHGILQLTLPKREEVKTRTIKIES
jgi:HSP20 family molecular chaperone IbpA